MKKLIFALMISAPIFAQTEKVKLVNNAKENKVEVYVGGEFLTNYYYPGEDLSKKPVLYPILSSKGATITRGFPIDPRPGERVDHPHHIGMWLNYEDVNGYDYWNNSNNIVKGLQSHKFGTIYHNSIEKISSKGKVGEIVVTATWVDDNGKGEKTLAEKTTYRFQGTNEIRIIDRITTLTAISENALFTDVKDGMFAIRMARELEIPSNKPEIYTDAHGIETKVPVLNNEGVTGDYESSEGITGEKVWSTRAKWMNLKGIINGGAVNVAILDHPSNISYPSYWHARGYGLFAVNPLGVKIFTNGKQELNLNLKKGESVTFKYRTIVADKNLSKEELDKMQEDFSKE